MSSGGIVQVTPSAFQSGAAAPARGAGATDNLTNSLMSTLNTFLGDISPLAGQPIIGPGATALMEAIDAAGRDLQLALGCFGTGLNIMAPAMMHVAAEFVSRDSSLANTFRELEGLLPQVESYATPIKLMQPTPAEVALLNQYLALAGQGKPTQIPMALTKLNITIPSPHRSFWGSVGHAFATAWNDTGGQVVHFIYEHRTAFEIAGVVAIAIAGAITLQPEVEGADAALAASIGGADAATTVAAAGAADATVAAGAAATETVTLSPGDLALVDQFQAELANLDSGSLPANFQLPSVPVGG